MNELLATAIAAVAAYLLGLSRSRRERIEGIYTEAFKAVAALHAARYIPSHVDPSRVPNIPEDKLEEVQVDLGVEALKRFVLAAERARASLGAVYPYCREVRPYWEKFEIAENETDDVLALLSNGLSPTQPSGKAPGKMAFERLAGAIAQPVLHVTPSKSKIPTNL